MTSVLLVDDDPRIRDAVRALIAAEPRYSLVAEAGSVAEGTARAKQTRPDVILLDLGLPDGKGTRMLDELRGEEARPIVVVLTVFDDDEHIFEALRAGAVGYLLKEDVGARLLTSLDDVQNGGSPMSPSIARRVLSSFAVPSSAVPSLAVPSRTEDAAPVLTARERQVTELLAHGSTYDEVGRALGITKNTVRTFIRSIYDKLHVCSKTEAVREAMRLGIVERP
jgi:DNA-binding NarL/FixJ family response regulator